MKKKKKKINKNRKKFFIILTCYIAVFIITCVTTAATLAWFNGGTFADNTIYMGGPVYLYFGDTNDRETSKENNLVVTTPPGWDYLYPGMNIQLQARAIVQGAKFDHEYAGNQTTVYSTGAVLRARVMINVLPPEDSDLTPEQNAIITQDIYKSLWRQIKYKALTNSDDRNEGVWIFDDDYEYSDSGLEEDHFFYYVKPSQDFEDSGKYELLDVGGTDQDAYIGFLDQAVLTLSGVELDNDHADCRITFTIVFHGLQAFFPYTVEDIGTPYPNAGADRSPSVTLDDVGTPKPMTVENSRKFFYESFDDIYEGDEGTI